MSTSRSIWLSILTVFALACLASATAAAPAEPRDAAHYCNANAESGTWAMLNAHSIGEMGSVDYLTYCGDTESSSAPAICTLSDSYLENVAAWSMLNADSIGEMASENQSQACIGNADSPAAGVCTMSTNHLANLPPSSVLNAHEGERLTEAANTAECANA